MSVLCLLYGSHPPGLLSLALNHIKKNLKINRNQTNALEDPGAEESKSTASELTCTHTESLSYTFASCSFVTTEIISHWNNAAFVDIKKMSSALLEQHMPS